MQEKKYKIYKNIRMRISIFGLPIRGFFIFLLILVLLIGSCVFGISVGGIVIRTLLLFLSFYFLKWISSKSRKYHVFIGEKPPKAMNLCVYNPHKLMRSWIGALSQISKKRKGNETSL